MDHLARRVLLGAQITFQCYNLIHLAFNGYGAILKNCQSFARLLSKALEASGWYDCVSDVHSKKGEYVYKDRRDEGRSR